MAPTAPTQPWNTLEIAKLVLAALTPVMVAVLGLVVNRSLKRVEHLQWAGQKLIDKRLEVYSALAPVLNDLYCYFDYIGDWKMMPPNEVLALKRTIDRLFYVNAPLFSPAFHAAYKRFIDACFVPGPVDEFESSALIRADPAIRGKMFAKRGEHWKRRWDALFAPPEQGTPRNHVVHAYREMMAAFAEELGVAPGGPPPGRPLPGTATPSARR